MNRVKSLHPPISLSLFISHTPLSHTLFISHTPLSHILLSLTLSFLYSFSLTLTHVSPPFSNIFSISIILLRYSNHSTISLSLSHTPSYSYLSYAFSLHLSQTFSPYLPLSTNLSLSLLFSIIIFPLLSITNTVPHTFSNIHTALTQARRHTSFTSGVLL